MGMHPCHFCTEAGVTPETSSGDTTLTFSDGKAYVMPDMITHYILEHDYVPPDEFRRRIMSERPTFANPYAGAFTFKGVPERVGYLLPGYKEEQTMFLAVERLELLRQLTMYMREAKARGTRTQTRGV